MKIKTKILFKIVDKTSKTDAEIYELYETLSNTKDEECELRENDVNHFIKEIDKLMEKLGTTWQEVKNELKKEIKKEHKNGI